MAADIIEIDPMLCTQAKEKRQAKEAQLAKAQMDAARRGGVSWGMAEEAALEEDLENVTEGTASLCVLAVVKRPICHETHLCCQQEAVNTTLQDCVVHVTAMKHYCIASRRM